MRRWAIFALLFYSGIHCWAEPPIFDALVVPSIADKELDFWFYTPPDSGPKVPQVGKVYRNQTFMVLMFCRAIPSDNQTNVNISYDLKVVRADGKAVIDEKNLPYYAGPILDRLILSNESVLEMAFDEAEAFGTYEILATFYENVSNRSFVTSVKIELIEYSKPEPFASDNEVSDWVMHYFSRRDPVRSFAAIASVVETSPAWLKKNYMTLAFFRRIFVDNPFLWEYYSKFYHEVGDADKKKLLLVAAVTPAEEKKEFLEEVKDEMRSYYESACRIRIPKTDKAITSPEQLDILWAEFFASGTYEPVRRIVGTLGGQKGVQILISGAAEWSLTANCRQFDLVRQYCRTIYENEILTEEAKDTLGKILAKVERRTNDPNTPGESLKEIIN